MLDVTTTHNQKKTQKEEFILFTSVGVIDKYNFYEYIAVMLDWWIGITEALSSVHSKITSPYFRKKIDELITYISSGDSFSKSMKKVPDIFPAAEVSVIEAWETTGQLSRSLLKLSDDLKKIHDLKNKVKSALTYPLIIMLVLVLAITLVMVYVIPQLKPLFEWSDAELPIQTVLLIAASDFVAAHFFLLWFIVFAIIWGFFIFASTKEWKLALEKKILHIPLFGKVYKNYTLANIASTLWNLVGSGVSIIKSLRLTGSASKSSTYKIILDEVAEKVSAWKWIIASMQEVDAHGEYFTADYLQMLSVGEKTATLEEVSKKLAYQYEKEVDYSLANLTKWIEPMAILIAGTFVVWFAMAIFGAIMQVTQAI